MHTQPLSLDFYVSRLRQATPFAVVRFGDGELDCILGKDGETCDRQTYSPAMSAELFQCLVHPRPMYYCLGPRATAKVDIAAFMRRRGLHIEWYDTETLLDAATRGELWPFVDALQHRQVLTVGPAHLFHHPAYQAVNYVEVPYVDAFTQRHRIKKDILERAEAADVILFSAGPTAKILIWQLQPILGGTHTLLDVGSLWDWMAGIDSRSYSRKWSPEEKGRLRCLNLGLG